jgi:hypothetical protein
MIPFQIVLIVLALIVIVVGAVISDPLLMLLGALMAAMAITGLGMALRMRRRQSDQAPQRTARG